MRRGNGGDAVMRSLGEASFSPSFLRPSGGGDDDGARSSSFSSPSTRSELKIILGGVVLLCTCTAYYVVAAGRPFAGTQSSSKGTGSQHITTGGGKSFRTLNMQGLKEGQGSRNSNNGQGGGEGGGGGEEEEEWVTCRAYEEDKLGPHKKVGTEVYCLLLLAVAAVLLC